MEALEFADCEPDVGLHILQQIDDYYLGIYADELKRQRATPNDR